MMTDYSGLADRTGETVVTLRTLDGREVVRMFPSGNPPPEDWDGPRTILGMSYVVTNDRPAPRWVLGRFEDIGK